MNEIKTIRWENFQAKFSKTWRQGEHLVIVGATGSGKTRLLRELIRARTYHAVMATKPYDAEMDRLVKFGGYTMFTDWPIDLSAHSFPKRVIWPEARVMNALKLYQKPAFKLAFDHIYTVGGWTVIIDELYFFCNLLKMMDTMKLYLTQARSLHITLVQCSQRTAWVPVESFNQSTHLFFFAENDERNLSVISGIAYKFRNEVKAAVCDLLPHHFLYFNRVSKELCISCVTT
ncbi:MAG: hypothetical protein AB7I44_21165 [Hyphomicrobiaceae bacterium]